MERNIFIILLLILYSLLFVQASTPGFDIKVGKSWITDSVSFTQFDGEIVNDSKLKLSNWYVEIPYDKSKNNLHGNWGCDIEVQDDKIVITGGDTNGVIKVSTTATFGFIVSNPDSNFDVENAILYVNSKEIPIHTEAENSEENNDGEINVGLPFEDNRYFLESMDIAELKDAATAMSITEVKAVIFKELVDIGTLSEKFKK